MEKLNSLPGAVILVLDGSRSLLDRAIEGRIPDDIKEKLIQARERIDVAMHLAQEAEQERNPNSSE
jgi:hypothetical protein